MLSRLTVLSCVSFIALTACATQQENPYYKYSSKYKGAPITTVAQAPTVIQTAPVSYDTANYSTASYNGGQASYTRVNHECLRKEKSHELLGAGLGGTIGAIAGNKLIGGTKGTVIGAGLGGAAGYGIGDKTVDCNPQTVSVQQSRSPAAYQTTPSGYHATPTPAGYRTVYQSAPVIAEPYVSPTDSEFNSISETGTPGYQVLQAQVAQPYEVLPETTSVATSIAQYNGPAQQVSYDYTANTVAASAPTIAIPSEARVLGGSYGGYGSHMVKDGDTVYSLSRKHCVGIHEIQSLNNLNASYGIKIGDQLQLPASNC